MGLDYHWDKSPKDIQHEVFRKQIRLAKKVKLPIIIHNREATADIVHILKEEGQGKLAALCIVSAEVWKLPGNVWR